jgi:hypothetical protein
MLIGDEIFSLEGKNGKPERILRRNAEKPDDGI